MKVSVHFETAPSLVDWQDVLTSDGWKITAYDVERLRAKNRFGESKFPVRNATTWELTVREDSHDGVHVEVSVDAFAESEYARQRLLETVAELAAAVDGSCETNQSLSIDVLGRLRRQSANYET